MGKYALRFTALGYLFLILIGPLIMMVWRTTEDLDGAWEAISNPNTVSVLPDEPVNAVQGQLRIGMQNFTYDRLGIRRLRAA